MVEPARPAYWSLAPTHGNHCGPGTFSDKAPVSEVDAVCQKHDGCYDKAKGSRHLELICDERACRDVDKLEDSPHWDPSFYERQYARGMSNVFCGNEISLPEDHGMKKAHFVTDEIIAKWEPLPQRQPRKRSLPKKSSPKPSVQQKTQAHLEPVAVTTSVEHPVSRRTEVKKEVVDVKVAVQPQKPKSARKKKGPQVAKGGKGQQKKKQNKKSSTNIKSMRINWKNPSRRFVDYKRGSRHIVSGCDLIDAIKLTSVKNANGTVVNNGYNTGGFVMNPLNFSNTRLKQIAPLYQKWKINRLRFIYVRALGEFFNGSFLHYYDYDPSVNYSAINGTEKANQIAAAHTNEQPFPVQECSVVTVDSKQLGNGNDYWLKQTGEIRTYSAGSYYFFVQDAISMSTGSITYPLSCGRVYMDYDLEFYGDALDENNPGSTASNLFYAGHGSNGSTYPAMPTTLGGYGLLAYIGAAYLQSKTQWDAGTTLINQWGNPNPNMYFTREGSDPKRAFITLGGLKASTDYMVSVRLSITSTGTTVAGSQTSFDFIGSGLSSSTKLHGTLSTPGGNSVCDSLLYKFTTTTSGGEVAFGDPSGASAVTSYTSAAGSVVWNIIIYELGYEKPSGLLGCPWKKALDSKSSSRSEIYSTWTHPCGDTDCDLCCLMKVTKPTYSLASAVEPSQFDHEEQEPSSDSDDDAVMITPTNVVRLKTDEDRKKEKREKEKGRG